MQVGNEAAAARFLPRGPAAAWAIGSLHRDGTQVAAVGWIRRLRTGMGEPEACGVPISNRKTGRDCLHI